MILTEDHKILLALFIIFTIVQLLGIVKSFVNAKIRGYSWRHYNRHLATDFEVFCILFLELELGAVALYFLYTFIFSII